MSTTRLAGRAVRLIAAATALLLSTAGTAAAAPLADSRADHPGTLRLQVVPPLAGVVVTVDGATARSNARGEIAVPVRNFNELAKRLSVPDTEIAPDRKVFFDRYRGNPDSGVHGKQVELGVRTSRLVSWEYLNRFGQSVSPGDVQNMRLRSSTGQLVDLSGEQLKQPLWVSESRTQQGPNGLASKPLYWVVDWVTVGGSSVVNRAQQRFVPLEIQHWVVQLLFYQATFTSADLIFGDRIGSGLQLTWPDGRVQRLPYGPDGTVTLPDLPRATYTVRVYGDGVSFARPVSISKDQTVSLQVISWLDLTLITLLLLSVAVGLVLIGRPRLRPHPLRWLRGRPGGQSRGQQGGQQRGPGLPEETGRRRRRRHAPEGAGPLGQRRRRPDPGSRQVGVPARLLSLFALLPTVLLTGVVVLTGAVGAARPATAAPAASDPVPALAYYYIWYTPSSWNRAKIDYPTLGRYSSDDVEIMRRHIRMAKAARINGFLVSWKHRPDLDQRLADLVALARAEQFKLGIVYQGLDFSRHPLPLETVRADLTMFADKYAADPVFDIFGKPAVIWTGTDQFGSQQIDDTVRGLRSRISVLGTAKSVEDYEASANVLDGDAYYWSSTEPSTNSQRKLTAMGAAVHAHQGLWIAPAAPGFDARLVGGQKTVARHDGETLRRSYEAARSSDPDAVGVISWNEFSENTHIEPSERYGARDINTLARLRGATSDVVVAPDSSSTGHRHWGLNGWSALAALAVTAVLLPFIVVRSRRRRAARLVNKLDEGAPA